jgi:6-phosphogluconolactonase
MTQEVTWKPYESIDQLAEAVCQRVLDAADKAIKATGAFKLVLAGGTAPVKAYQLLATKQQDWGKWHIYHGDERCLPVDDAERNSLVADQKWLNLVTIPKAQIHAIPAELGAEAGAESYAKDVTEAGKFDLVLLGMGEDGHTASLFPGHVHNLDELTHAVHNSFPVGYSYTSGSRGCQPLNGQAAHFSMYIICAAMRISDIDSRKAQRNYHMVMVGTR